MPKSLLYFRHTILHVLHLLFKGDFALKRFISCFLTLVFLLLPLCTVKGSAAFNSSVIFDKNADKRAAPASLTKIITAVLTIENCENLDEVITIKQSSINAISGTNSSTAGLLPGEEISIRNLLYCMMVKSANEAAVVLADYIGGGSVANFVKMMNDYVMDIGCQNTHFMNPHGLDAEGHYTTANDLAIITKHALTLPLFSEIVNTVNFKLPASNKSGERNLLSTNWMINPNFKTYYLKYAEGIKTGTTKNAGHCIVSKASKDGYNYLAIVMGAPEEDVNGDGNPDNCAFLECKKIFQWAFQNIRLTKVASPTQIATVVDVNLSWNVDHVRLVPETEVTALVPVGNDESSVLLEVIPEETPQTVNAPIKKGDVLGKARILYAEDEIATVNLVAAEDVHMSMILYILNGVKNLFKSTIFQIVFILILLVLAVYIGLIIRHSRMKKRRRAPKTVKNFRNIK